jgi:putative sterol carrier protein
MTDTTAHFFEELAQRGREPLLAKAKGTIRFEIAEGKQKRTWLVDIDRGNVSVSRRNASADSTVRVDRVLFDKLVTGQANAMAEVLRGRVAVEGDLDCVILFQRLFAGPQSADAPG